MKILGGRGCRETQSYGHKRLLKIVTPPKRSPGKGYVFATILEDEGTKKEKAESP
jgi:hypothetical protein